MPTNRADDTAPDVLEQRLDTLEAALADMGEQLAALVRHTASDVRLDGLQALLEQQAARISQLERHLS